MGAGLVGARGLYAARKSARLYPFYASTTTNIILTNISTGPTVISSNLVTIADLRKATGFRIQALVNVAATGGGTLRLQYSTNGSVWVDAEASGTSADISLTATGHILGTLGRIAAGAKIQSCYLRLAGYGGNGTDDPAFRMLAVEFEES